MKHAGRFVEAIAFVAGSDAELGRTRSKLWRRCAPYITLGAKVLRHQFALGALLAAIAGPACAHGIETVTPFVIWPALALGGLGGVFSGLRNVRRLDGLSNVFATYLVLLAIGALIAWSSDVESLITALEIAAFSTSFGIVLGAIPLLIGYVAGEAVARHIVGKRARLPKNSDGA